MASCRRRTMHAASVDPFPQKSYIGEINLPLILAEHLKAINVSSSSRAFQRRLAEFGYRGQFGSVGAPKGTHLYRGCFNSLTTGPRKIKPERERNFAVRRACNRAVTAATRSLMDVHFGPVKISYAFTGTQSGALRYTKDTSENGVPEGNRTPDPRFRKRDFGASEPCKGVRVAAKQSTRVRESGRKALCERA